MMLGLSLSLCQPSNTGAGLAPALQPMSGWLRGSFAGSPWAGTASAGTSAANDATEGIAPPAVGASLNGYASAEGDGINDRMTLDGAVGDYITETKASGWALVRFASAGTASLAAPYNEPAIFTEASGNFGLSYSTAGVKLFRAAGGIGGWKSTQAALATGTIGFVTWRMDLDNNQLEIGLDGPPDRSMFCLPFTMSVDHPSRVPYLFRDFSAAVFLAARLWDFGVRKDLASDADFAAALAYVNTRYALSLSRASNYQPGTYSVTEAPAATYTGTTVTTSAAFTQRDGAKLHPLNGKYWLLGGWASSGRAEWSGEQTTNEVYSADIGTPGTWTLALAHNNSPPTAGAGARWTRRHAHGSYVLDGYIYVIGGDQYVAGTPDIWRSNDPGNVDGWTRMLAAGPWNPKLGLCVGAYNGAGHILGGTPRESSLDYPASSQHFIVTNNGQTVTQLPDAPFNTSFQTQLLEHDGLLFSIGGNAGGIGAGERIYSNGVWAYNGTAWRLQNGNPPWAGRMWIDTAVYDNKLWVLSGRDSDSTDVSDAWSSPDGGKSWDPELNWPGPPTHASGVTSTPEDGIVVATGFGSNLSVYTLKANP